MALSIFPSSVIRQEHALRGAFTLELARDARASATCRRAAPGVRIVTRTSQCDSWVGEHVDARLTRFRHQNVKNVFADTQCGNTENYPECRDELLNSEMCSPTHTVPRYGIPIQTAGP
jgi:hypothetical protein